MFPNALVEERAPVAAAIDPDAYATNTYDSGEIDVALYEQLMFIGCAGTLGSSATMTFSVVGSAASGGSLTAVTGKAATALTQAGTDSDKQAVINLRGEDLLAQGFRFVKGRMVVGTATSDGGMLILGIKKHGSADHLNSLMSERYAVIGVVDPDANAPGDFDSDVIDMSKFGTATAYVLLGDVGDTSTVDGAWYQATDTGKTGEKAITGKSMTQVDGSDSPAPGNVQVEVSIRADDLDADNGYRYAYFRHTIADTTSPENQTTDSAVVVVAGDPRVGSASSQDLASVDEIVE